MNPLEHPEFLQRFAIIVALVVLTFRGLSAFFRHVLRLPYPRWHEVLAYVAGTALLTMVLASWTGVLTMLLALVVGSSWTMWDEGHKSRLPPAGDSQDSTDS